MDVANHHSEQQLQRMLDQELRADRAKRLRTVLLAQQGFTAPEIATCTGFSRRTVQDWVARYNREGLAGLKTRPGRGRKPPLTPEQEEQLKQRIQEASIAIGQSANGRRAQEMNERGIPRRSSPWIKGRCSIVSLA